MVRVALFNGLGPEPRILFACSLKLTIISKRYHNQVRLQPTSQISDPQTQASGHDLRSSGASPISSFHRKEWRDAVLLLIIAFIALAVLFRQTFAGMISLWQYGAYSHGYLIFPISAFLIWRRRDVLSCVQPSASFLAVLAAAGLAFVWIVGELANANLIRQMAVVALVPVLICAVLGVNVARVLLFPLGFLFFAVPAGSSLIPLLQDFTAWFTVSGLHLTGIPAVLEGRRIFISSGVWEVAEACSGLRYLISSISLGTLFAYLIYRSWIRRALFLAASIVVPIIANGVRAYSIVVLAHKVNPDLAVGIDHIIYGWIFFAFIMLLLFMVGLRWQEAGLKQKTSPILVTSQQLNSKAHVSQLWRVFVTVTAILIMISASIAAGRLQNGVSPIPVASLPEMTAPWYLVRTAESDSWLKLPNADLTQTGSFTDGQHVVKLAIVFFVSQPAQPSLINSVNEQLGGPGWTELEERPRKTSLNQRSLSVAEDIFTNRSNNRMSWSWYWVDNQFTSSSSKARLLRAKARLLRHSPLTARIVLLTQSDSVSEGSAVLNDFLRHCDLLKALENSSR